jgi:hypothetical protein
MAPATDFAGAKRSAASTAFRAATALPKLDQVITPVLPAGSFNGLTKTWSWDPSQWGNWWFGVDLMAAATVKGAQDKLSLTGTGKAQGKVLGAVYDLLVVQGGASTPTTSGSTEPLRANASARVLGNDLFPPIDVSHASTITKEGGASIGVDKSRPFSVGIGPVSLSMKAGFAGSAGFQYGLYLTPLNLRAKAYPFVRTNGYMQVGGSLVIAEAGVGGNLVFLNEDLNIDSRLAIVPVNGRPYYSWGSSAYNELTALSGNLYAYVTVDYWLDSKTWRWNIFSWSGIHLDGYLWNAQGTGPVFSPLIATVEVIP